MTYFDNCYKKLSKPKRPQSFDEFKKFIISESKYMFWARCQYEIILSDWPCQISKEKWDNCQYQKKRDARHYGRTATYLFTNKLKCSTCGRFLGGCATTKHF